MRALRYAIEEAALSLWRGRQAGVLSTLTIALALFVLGGFLLVTANLDRLGSEWSRAAEMSVYLKDEITPAERAAIEAALRPDDLVAAHEYISKSDALARFKQTFADLSPALDSVGGNPLPASFEVRLRPASESGAGVDSLAARLQQLPGVADVRYDRQWLDRLLSAIRVIRGVGFLLGSVLTIAAALTVANVVRLALYARREELDIMQLVGAPQAYIRGPFVMEGVLQGGAGALVALAVLGAGFLALRARYFVPLAAALNVSSIEFLPVELCVLLVLGGMAVGCLGGLVAAWNR
ncbi:MAG TPA: permease-like cell division protein FtsX [Vicinamibacterales bacterium]|nr:permease-like cell division protein FtsX [Vicinamibacterales bacterium]